MEMDHLCVITAINDHSHSLDYEMVPTQNYYKKLILPDFTPFVLFSILFSILFNQYSLQYSPQHPVAFPMYRGHCSKNIVSTLFEETYQSC